MPIEHRLFTSDDIENGSLKYADQDTDSASTSITPTSAGDYAVEVTLSGLTGIGVILDIHIDTDPLQDPGHLVNRKIVGNSYGATLAGVSQGGTVTVTVEALEE